MSLSCVPRAGRHILPLPIHSACRTRLPSSTRYSSPHLPADTLRRCTHGRPCILETCFRLAARLYTRKADPPGRDHRPVRGTPGNGDPPSRRASFLFASTKTQALSWSGQARPDRYALVLVALFPACAAGAAAGRGRPPASAPWSDLLRDWNVRTQCNFSTRGFPSTQKAFSARSTFGRKWLIQPMAYCYGSQRGIQAQASWPFGRKKTNAIPPWSPPMMAAVEAGMDRPRQPTESRAAGGRTSPRQ